MAKSLKIIGIVLGILVVFLAGAEAYAALSDDEDWALVQRLTKALTGIKNEPTGCCLPLCSESGQTICEQSGGAEWVEDSLCSEVSDCKKVCCPPHDGELTKLECEQAGGKPQEENQGYYAQLQGASETNLEYGTGRMEYVFNLHSCGVIPNSEWEGTWDAKWTYAREGEAQTDELKAQPINFDLAGSETTVSLVAGTVGERTVTFKLVGEEQISSTVNHQNLNPVSVESQMYKCPAVCYQ